MLRRSRCVLIFSFKTYVFQRHTKFVRLLPKYFASLIFFCQPERAGGSIVLLRLAHRAAARYRRVPMDQSRGCGVAHTAAAAVVVEQEIVRVVRAAAVDPRDRTAHHNQALSFGAEF